MLDEQGIYFFHISFLKEVSEDWLSKGHMGNSAKLFMKLVFLKSDETSFVTCDRTIKDLMTCDRTITEVSKTKYILKSVPGFIDLITEKFLPEGEEESDNDLYALKVASFKRIGSAQAYFLVSDSEKARIQQLATSKGYSLKIISQKDFEE